MFSATVIYVVQKDTLTTGVAHTSEIYVLLRLMNKRTTLIRIWKQNPAAIIYRRIVRDRKSRCQNVRFDVENKIRLLIILK